MATFNIVYIPADAQKEAEEWNLPLPQDQDELLACLTKRLRQHFSQTTGASSVADQRRIFAQQIQGQLPKGTQLTDEMLDVMMKMDGLVDSVPLQVNCKSTNFIGVNMYVDDRGTAKGLPMNQRASILAQLCGKPVEVRGDAFVGRVFDDEDGFRRIDFNLDELTPQAEWIQLARATIAAGTQSTRTQAAQLQQHIQSQQQQEKKCPGCSRTGTSRCSRCKKTYYCSVECQKADWKQHKLSCKK